MRCSHCEGLEREYGNRTDDYINLVQRQKRMFRTGEVSQGSELAEMIVTAKTAMHEGLRALDEHRQAHWKGGHSLRPAVGA